METPSKRLSDTRVQVASKIYQFRSPQEADRFEQCLRDGGASRCVADVPPETATDAYPPGTRTGSGAGITIAPPPGGLDSDE
ncbi:hypothetical protein [Paraburkholderia atlantica]|uniref:Uncharacterized protein n=1 Tax=Paraburkholderia atlantica TaxID=2654982 RepID=A0A7W8UY86_PARAM|nr:hypothetical protein [Paraburkholderia atlantica]MBB5415915.1 hypothetical protein [Paraburkholderia atlantica]MBB5424394.1 hypothetical protein [Paraburkholderia atlantica]